MFSYECHICGALCDPGELENGNCQTIRSLNQLMRARYAQQPDGQMVMGGVLNG